MFSRIFTILSIFLSCTLYGQQNDSGPEALFSEIISYHTSKNKISAEKAEMKIRYILSRTGNKLEFFEESARLQNFYEEKRIYLLEAFKNLLPAEQQKILVIIDAYITAFDSIITNMESLEAISADIIASYTEKLKADKHLTKFLLMYPDIITTLSEINKKAYYKYTYYTDLFFDLYCNKESGEPQNLPLEKRRFANIENATAVCHKMLEANKHLEKVIEQIRNLTPGDEDNPIIQKAAAIAALIYYSTFELTYEEKKAKKDSRKLIEKAMKAAAKEATAHMENLGKIRKQLQVSGAPAAK